MGALDILLQPIRIGPVTLKNRLEAAPSMPILATPGGAVTPELIEYYRHKARGGVALVTVGESSIDADRAPSHRGQLRVDGDSRIRGLSELVRAIKREGACASIELSHAGRQASPRLLEGRRPMAPSALPAGLAPMPESRTVMAEEMTLAMIDQVVDDFGRAAWRAQQAGFETVLLHGGHGWLLSQFVSPLSNKRTDEYGGSLHNRSRFAVRVLERIRERCGPGLAVQYRFSADELVPGGLGPEEAIGFARIIEPYVDGLHVSCGVARESRTAAFTHSACYLPHCHNAELARRVRESVSKPVTVVGGVMDLDEAAELIASQKADLVAMCRALIADPSLPARALSGRGRAVVPCIRCNECLYRGSNWQPIRCSVNPAAGRELESARVTPAPAAKKVLVIGGGPAGMQAALTCAARGHEVMLCEQQDFLGGNLFAASRPAFKDDMKKFLEYLLRCIEEAPITVRLGERAGIDTVRLHAPDVVVAAVGAKPEWPDIPGLTGSGAVWAGEVLAGRVECGHRVVVAGGGRIGCETALLLAQQGREVTLIEAQDRLAKDLNPINRTLLVELASARSVNILVRSRIVKAGPSFVHVCSRDSRSRKVDVVGTDSIVFAGSLSPRADLAEELSGLVGDVRSVGDCRAPGMLLNAVHEGFEAGLAV